MTSASKNLESSFKACDKAEILKQTDFKGEEINSVRANYTPAYHMVYSVMVKSYLIWFYDYGLTLEKHWQARTDQMKAMDP